MKNLIITVLTCLLLLNFNYNNIDVQADNSLESNQTILYYMYSMEEGHYLLDPNAEYENVIFVDLDEHYISEESAHHGNKFIGTFDDESLWELVNIEEVK